ncbi:MAG: hypothetical protein JWR09_2340 [Mucilaginibacter sp.]|nr:hypothetical protein [Mucilaginibacter sp.]
MENLKFNNVKVGAKQALTRDELKNVKGGKAAGFTCWASTSCCGDITYYTDSAEVAQAWYNFYAAANDSPDCVEWY